MKCHFFLIVILFCGLISKAQEKTDFFYKDNNLTKKVSENKAKFKKTVSQSSDGIVNIQIFNLSTNCRIRVENYKDNIPVGVWTSQLKNCTIEYKRDFSNLTYTNKQIDTLYNNKIKEPNLENFEKAQYGDNENAIFQYIGHKLNYPMEAIESNASGRVYLQFIIKADGSIKMVSVLRSVNPYLDYESWKLIEHMPRWNPAKKNGQPIDSYYILPIVFSLK